MDENQKNEVQSNVKKIWEVIFKVARFGALAEPIQGKNLRNPSNKICQNFLYLYSMDMFLYKLMANASRN